MLGYAPLSEIEKQWVRHLEVNAIAGIQGPGIGNFSNSGFRISLVGRFKDEPDSIAYSRAEVCCKSVQGIPVSENV